MNVSAGLDHAHVCELAPASSAEPRSCSGALPSHVVTELGSVLRAWMCVPTPRRWLDKPRWGWHGWRLWRVLSCTAGSNSSGGSERHPLRTRAASASMRQLIVSFMACAPRCYLHQRLHACMASLSSRDFRSYTWHSCLVHNMPCEGPLVHRAHFHKRLTISRSHTSRITLLGMCMCRDAFQQNEFTVALN